MLGNLPPILYTMKIREKQSKVICFQN